MAGATPVAASAKGMTLYRLQTAAAIGQVLQDMHSQRSVLSLFAVPAVQVDEAVPPVQPALAPAPLAMARLLEVDMAEGKARWHVAGPTQPPEHVEGVAHMAGSVRVQCTLQGPWQAVPQGDEAGWVLQAPWPAEVQQLQRRRHPRLSVPLGHNYSASFLFGRRRCELDIDDLSIAGIALRGTRPETAMLFIGRQLPKVSVFLADGSVLQADLQVRSRRSYRSFLLGEQVLVGCSIERIDEEDKALLARLLAQGMWAAPG